MNNLKNFHNNLKNISNKIIKKNFNNILILSNDWLYYKRLHVVELEKYKILKKNILIFILKYIFIFFKSLIKNLIKIILSLKFYLKKQEIQKEKIDIVFVTYKFDSNYKISNDSYFSEIYKKLHYKKKKYFIIAANHQKNFLENKNKIKNFYELNKNANFLLEVDIFIKTFFYSLKYFFLALSKTNTFEIKFYLLFSLSFLYGNTLDNIKYYYQILDIIRKKKPKSVVSIYEGHALERLIFKAAKEVNKKIKTVAYNHSIVSNDHNAIFLNIKNKINPDRIVFANQLSKRIYFTKNKHKNKNLFCVSKSKSWKKSLLKKGNYCLVAPEGLDSENIKMLDFISKYLRVSDNLKFIWRFHPIYLGKEKKFIKKNFYDFDNFKKKIIISSNKLNNDIKMCKFILYRGSTLVIKGLMNNLIPINLDLDENFKNNFLIDSKILSNLETSKPENLDNLINNKNIKIILKNRKKILNDYAIINNNIKINYFL